MKTSGNLVGGTLKPADREVYARYLLKYVQAYADRGVPIYAITVQNEPGFSPKTYPGMEMSAATRAVIIGDYLGPMLAASHLDTVIFGWDHNWNHPEQPLEVLANPTANPYVHGIAWHCYAGDPTAQTLVHNAFPAKATLITECSDGDWQTRSEATLWFGSEALIGGTRNWAEGVLFWNLLLDDRNGPHAGGCINCIGIFRVHTANSAMARTRDYYSLAHFSRFVRRGAERVASSAPADGITNVAFLDGDGTVTLEIVNRRPASQRRSSNAAAISATPPKRAPARSSTSLPP